MNVLVVEDNRAMRRLIHCLLKRTTDSSRRAGSVPSMSAGLTSSRSCDRYPTHARIFSDRSDTEFALQRFIEEKRRFKGQMLAHEA